MNDRRTFLRYLGASGLWLATPGAFADELARTPRQTEGPFYPDHLPLDKDNDLIVVGKSKPAMGTIAHVTGRILTTSGEPVSNVTVEIWQCDVNGVYLHTGSNNRDKQDKNFQGFGRFETGKKGEYRFRTIKPVPYDNRCPHIHFAIDKGGKRMLTTQLYIKGEPMNEKDGVYKAIKDPKDKVLLTADFVPVKKSRIGEVSAHFNIVIGSTPEDMKGDSFRQRRS